MDPFSGGTGSAGNWCVCFHPPQATSLALDIYKEYGTDSQIGLIASIMMSSTGTVFYTMSVYFFDSQSVKDPLDVGRSTSSTFAGIAASVVLGEWDDAFCTKNGQSIL